MRLDRFFHQYATRAFLIATAIVGALLLIGGMAKAAPPRGALPVTGALAPTATVTTLTTLPLPPVVQGTMVTLTAKVAPQTAAGVAPQTAAGTVQFKDEITNLGDPVKLTNGTALGNISQLAVGSRQLSAVFIPTDPAVFAASTSQTVPFVVTARTPTATRTVLTTSSPPTITQATPVSLLATVSPAAAAGTVQFKDGTADLGSPATVSNGTASVTTLLPTVGAHQPTAVFTPTDSTAFSTSTSQAISLTVTAPSETVTPQAQQSGQSLDAPAPTVLDAHGVTVLDLAGSGDGGGLTLLGGQGTGDGGLTLLGGSGVVDGRGLTVLNGQGLTVLRTGDNHRGGLISELLRALL
jgi:Bacterial Ig-like domain (group 3)